MPKSIVIVYFSGTGNTELVTDLVARELTKNFLVDVVRVEDIRRGKAEFDLKKYDMIGVGYPIYGFNAPKIIADFIEQLPNASALKAFVFSTCAGPLYLNDIASFGVKKLLQAKGIEVFYERQIYMPANIATRYPDEVAKQLCNAAIRKSAEMAEEIGAYKIRLRRDRMGPRLMKWMYAWERNAWKLVSKDFRVLESCNGCKKCVQACPMDNISYRDGEILFGEQCTACYRCVYQCPEKAISGKKYQFAIFKDGYDIVKIMKNDELKGDYITPKTWGYYRVFRKYLFKK